MYLLRLQALINNQPLLLKQVVLYLSDGVSLPTLFHAITEQPIGNIFKTDASGLILSGLENVHHVFPQTCFNWEHSLLDRSVF